MDINLPILKKLKRLASICPQPLYVVGGFVRNQLAGLKQSPDIDICGSFSVDAFKSLNMTTVNKRLGTALIVFEGEKFEYTQFRCEAYDKDGSHTPISVSFTDNLFLDAKRRDFTVNSIYYDIKNDRLVDPLGGLNDLKNRLINSVDADRIFASDGLRLMRLCRFSAELGFSIKEETFRAAKQNSFRLNGIASERKRDELDKILNADSRYGTADGHYYGLNLLFNLGLFKYILPCIEDLNIPQNPKYHSFDVLRHTFLTVKYAENDIRLAALMHDTGKPIAIKKFGNMHNHANESEIITKNQLGQNGLKYPNQTVSEAARLVRLHMYDLGRNTSVSKMRLFVACNFNLIDKLNRLVIADGLATGKPNFIPPRFLHFKEMLLKEGAPTTLADLKINGCDAIKAGLKGAEINTVLHALLKDCIINPALNDRKWLYNRLNHLARQTYDKE